ncbi:uncharacterized protein LJ206_003287 isoform 1-T1 [Theristicus caerulescens]
MVQANLEKRANSDVLLGIPDTYNTTQRRETRYCVEWGQRLRDADCNHQMLSNKKNGVHGLAMRKLRFVHQDHFYSDGLGVVGTDLSQPGHYQEYQCNKCVTLVIETLPSHPPHFPRYSSIKILEL